MEDNPVALKLRAGIIPYVVSSDEFRRQGFYRTYHAYAYTRDLLAGLAGLGVASPVNWTPLNAVVDCGQHAVVVSNSPVSGEVDLFYRAAPV